MNRTATRVLGGVSLLAILFALTGVLFFYNAGHKTQASGFQSHIFAPYIDIGMSNAIDSIASSSGNKYVTAAFVNSSGCSPSFPNGAISTGAVNNIRNAGGDVIFSFGGYGGTELALACGDAGSLQQQYQSIVNTYGLTYLDFDIEHGQTDALGNTAATDRRNIALAGLQSANPGLKISYTLPAATSGILSNSIALLNNAKSHGVVVDRVNIMVMDYGGSMDMGQAAISASQGTVSSAGISYSHLGITPMIGQNDSPGEIFTYANAQTVLTFAQQNGVAELSFWSVGRDNGGCPGATAASSTCSGVSQGTNDFDHLYEQFNGGNTPPTNTPKPAATNTPKPAATNTPKPGATNTPKPGATNTPTGSSTLTFEAESLSSTTNGPANTTSSDTNCSGGVCMVFQATAAGNVVTYTTGTIPAGTYDLRIGVKKYNNKGIFQFASNGVTHGNAQDLYAAAATFTEVDIGSVTFSSTGTKSFSFTVTGKNASSSGYTIGLDYFKLVGGTTPSTATPTAQAGSTATPTKAPAATNTPTSGGSAWTTGVNYTVGTLVTYGGHTYKCLQAHTSQVGWEPPNVPALWGLVS